MKSLYIVDDRQPLWQQIALILEEINAEVRILTRQEAGRTSAEKRPDLLILSDESSRLLGPAAKELTKLVVTAEAPPGEVIRSRDGRNVIKLGWPMAKDRFFELTRRLLSVPERRPYRTSVLVGFRDGKERSVSGRSEDFSITGMAFRATAALSNNEEISLSFGPGPKGEGLRLDAAIVRSSPGKNGEDTLYGARFIGLSPAERHALEQFVWRIRRRVP